jgi:hypothetical protein
MAARRARGGLDGGHDSPSWARRKKNSGSLPTFAVVHSKLFMLRIIASDVQKVVMK